MTHGCIGNPCQILHHIIVISRRTVHEALTDATRIHDIRGGLSEASLEYLQLWEILSDVNLTCGVEDQHICPPSSGKLTTKSAYRFLLGDADFEPWMEILKTWAPLAADSLFGWPH